MHIAGTFLIFGGLESQGFNAIFPLSCEWIVWLWNILCLEVQQRLLELIFYLITQMNTRFIRDENTARRLDFSALAIFVTWQLLVRRGIIIFPSVQTRNTWFVTWHKVHILDQEWLPDKVVNKLGKSLANCGKSLLISFLSIGGIGQIFPYFWVLTNRYSVTATECAKLNFCASYPMYKCT